MHGKIKKTEKIEDSKGLIYSLGLITLGNCLAFKNISIIKFLARIVCKYYVLALVFGICLIILIKSINGFKYYGFTKVSDLKKYLYFIPLLFIMSINLWGGINTDYSIGTIVFHILNMFNIGFKFII